MSESALWTVLPAGIDADTGLLRATIFVSPRISTDGAGFIKLADCEAFSLWPQALRGLEFTVEVDGVGKEIAKLDDRITGYDPSDWKLVFGGDVGVRAARKQVADLGGRELGQERAAEAGAFVAPSRHDEGRRELGDALEHVPLRGFGEHVAPDDQGELVVRVELAQSLDETQRVVRPRQRRLDVEHLHAG